MKHTKLMNVSNLESADQMGRELPENNVLDFSTTLRELKQSVDPNLVRQRAGRRDTNGHVHMVDYVEWHTVADILDEHAPNWAHTVKNINAIGEIITVTVAITIDGVTREGIGTGSAISETGIKKAEHDALKRAAVKFGIARELYKKEFDSVEYHETVETQVALQKTNPVVSTLGDLVTAKQLGMIRGLARAAAVDADGECRKILGCITAELSKRAASDLIDHLQSLPRKGDLGETVSLRRAG